MQKVDPHPFAELIRWAAACLGFFIFLRCAEFTIISASALDPSKHLTLGDVLVKPDGQVSTWQLN